MKKLFVFPLIFLMLCGCTQKTTATPILNNISFTVEICYGEHTYSGNATILNDALNLIVIEPQEIKDLILTIDKNGLKAEFKGVSYSPDINSLPQGAVVQVLYKVLNDVLTKNVICNEKNCQVKGMVDGYNYTFVFAPSGLPLELKIDDLDLEIKFQNTTLK